jgi:hypothetical protein
MMQFLQELSRRNNKRTHGMTPKPTEETLIIPIDAADQIDQLRRELTAVKGCLAGIRLALADAGGFESTIKQIDHVLYGT